MSISFQAIVLGFGLGFNTWVAGGGAVFSGLYIFGFARLVYFNPEAALFQVNAFQANPIFFTDVVVAFVQAKPHDTTSIWMEDVTVVTQLGTEGPPIAQPIESSAASPPPPPPGQNRLLQEREGGNKNEESSSQSSGSHMTFIRVDGNNVGDCNLCQIAPGKEEWRYYVVTG